MPPLALSGEKETSQCRYSEEFLLISLTQERKPFPLMNCDECSFEATVVTK